MQYQAFFVSAVSMYDVNVLILLKQKVLKFSRIEGKVKVKCTLVQALRLCTGRTVRSGSRGIALLFHDHGTRRG
jgi:hypothetical protein